MKLRRYIRISKEKITVPKLYGQLLTDRCALITGGTSGIGFSIAEAFVNNGAKVVITGRDQKRLDKAVEDLKKSTGLATVYGFVSDNKRVEDFGSLISYINDELKMDKLDILVNNAGMNRGAGFPKTTATDFSDVMDTNLKGMYFLTQEVARYMISQKIKGNILNISSSAALRPTISPYFLSKLGIEGLTRGFAKKLIPDGIVVNGLAPGPTATRMLTDETENLYLPSNPSGRYVSPEEVANMAVVLVSDIGRMIVGDTVYITGGAGVVSIDDTSY